MRVDKSLSYGILVSYTHLDVYKRQGQYSMEPAHYAEVPKSVSETIVASRKKAE